MVMFALSAFLVLSSGCQPAQAYLPTLVPTAKAPEVIGGEVTKPQVEPAAKGNLEMKVEVETATTTAVDELPVTWTPVPESTPPTPTRAVLVVFP